MSDDEQDLAAEYALGVLDADARREAERRIARDPGFAAAVASWEARLGALADRVPPVQPSAQVWRNIERALGAAPRAGLWRNLAFWRGLSFGAVGVAAAAVVFVAVSLQQPARPLVAMLAPASGGPAFIATFDPARDTMVIIPAAFARAPERVAELWLIAPGDRPRSLGLLDPTRPVTLALPAAPRGQAKPDATLAVSLEPPGGSPTGQPTGPVIAQGKLSQL